MVNEYHMRSGTELFSRADQCLAFPCGNTDSSVNDSHREEIYGQLEEFSDGKEDTVVLYGEISDEEYCCSTINKENIQPALQRDGDIAGI